MSERAPKGIEQRHAALANYVRNVSAGIGKTASGSGKVASRVRQTCAAPEDVLLPGFGDFGLGVALTTSTRDQRLLASGNCARDSPLVGRSERAIRAFELP